MMIDATHPPKKNYLSLNHWERGVDPWHKDAFPDEFKYVGSTGPRKSGWYGIDWSGNVIYFVADGTEE